MKKLLLGLLGTGLLLTTTLTYAGELEEAQLKLDNIKMEFQLLQTRQQLLQFEAKELQEKITSLQEAKKATEPKTDKSKKTK